MKTRCKEIFNFSEIFMKYTLSTITFLSCTGIFFSTYGGFFDYELQEGYNPNAPYNFTVENNLSERNLTVKVCGPAAATFGDFISSFLSDGEEGDTTPSEVCLAAKNFILPKNTKSFHVSNEDLRLFSFLPGDDLRIKFQDSKQRLKLLNWDCDVYGGGAVLLKHVSGLFNPTIDRKNFDQTNLFINVNKSSRFSYGCEMKKDFIPTEHKTYEHKDHERKDQL